MTVADLIKHLKTLPQDAVVMRIGGEYNGDERYCSSVTYRKNATLGCSGNSVLID